LQAFGAESANDFRVEAVELGAPGDQRLAGGDGATGGGSVARYDRLRLEDILLAGKIERVNLEKAGLGIEEREAGVCSTTQVRRSSILRYMTRERPLSAPHSFNAGTE